MNILSPGRKAVGRFCAALLGSAAVLALSVSSATAAGFYLAEMGQPDMGTATAGRAAMARDAFTAFSNPAGMTRLDRSQLMVGALALDIHSEFEGETVFAGPGGGADTSGNGHNVGGIMPAASLNYVHVVTPDLRLGLSIGSYFGLAADYGDTWQGRYYVQKEEILTMAVNPTVAYRVNGWLSVGGGFTALYGKLKQDVAINNVDPAGATTGDNKLKIDSTDWGWGYNFGLLLEPTRSTRIGVAYRSAVDLKFDDVASVEGSLGLLGSVIQSRLNINSIDMKMTIPQAVDVSCYQQITDKLALMANVGWQNWKKFGDVGIDVSTASSAGSKTVDAGMDDTWHGAFGAHYRIAEPWLLMLGFAYDSSPLDGSHRTLILPLDRQYRYATGVEYTVNKDVTVGFDYTFIDAGKSKINQNRGPLAGHAAGEFTTNYINALALNMNWKF